MSIIIKEIVVRTTVERTKTDTTLSHEAIRKLKKEIIQEVVKIQEKKAKWEREW